MLGLWVNSKPRIKEKWKVGNRCSLVLRRVNTVALVQAQQPKVVAIYEGQFSITAFTGFEGNDPFHMLPWQRGVGMGEKRVRRKDKELNKTFQKESQRGEKKDWKSKHGIKKEIWKWRTNRRESKEVRVTWWSKRTWRVVAFPSASGMSSVCLLPRAERKVHQENTPNQDAWKIQEGSGLASAQALYSTGCTAQRSQQRSQSSNSSAF